MRRYTEHHVDRLGRRCEEVACRVKAVGWPQSLAFVVMEQLYLAQALLVEAQLQLREQKDPARHLARTEHAIRRARRALRLAYHRRQVLAASYKDMGDHLMRLLGSLRAIRVGLLLAPPEVP